MPCFVSDRFLRKAIVEKRASKRTLFIICVIFVTIEKQINQRYNKLMKGKC